MNNDIKTWLYDILQSINEIDSYYENRPGSFEEYRSDTKTKRAIERNLEIIGEAANRIFKKDKNFKISNVDKIIGTRNNRTKEVEAPTTILQPQLLYCQQQKTQAYDTDKTPPS